jgi:RHS repeat-associated protein
MPPANTAVTALATSETVYESGGRVAQTCTYPAGTSCGSTNSRHVDFTYDDLGRVLTQKTWDRGAGSDTLKFTKTMTWNPDGTPATVAEGSTTFTYEYDAAARPAKFKTGSTPITEWAYTSTTNLVASRKDVSLDATNPTASGYDWARRVISTDPPDSYTTGVVTKTYRLDGVLASQAFPSSVTETLGYDAVKRPTAISLGTAGSLSQAHDRAGNVKSEGRALTIAGASGDAVANDQSFDYDGLRRLTSSSLSAATRSYTYDLDGNRTQKVEDGTTIDYEYDRADQLAKQTIGGVDKVTSFDQYGNLLQAADNANAYTTYAFDEANRLTSISPAGGTAATFTLDPLDRHATRTVGATSDMYGYVGPTETAFETGTSGTRSLLDLDGSRLAVKNGSTVAWLVFDLHGSVAALCPAGGTTLSDAYRYDGFGQTIATAGTSTNPWRYRGLLGIDPSSAGDELYDMAARDYRPASGTFTQLDSVQGIAANPMTMNRYLYALANPATLVDPDGHLPAPPCSDCPGYDSGKDKKLWQENKQKAKSGGAGGGSGTSGAAPPVPKSCDRGCERSTFAGYAPWAIEQEPFLRDLTDNAGVACANNDPGACELVSKIAAWKEQNYQLYCSSHRAECEEHTRADLHDDLGILSLIPLLDLPSTATEMGEYATHGDWGGVVLSGITLAPLGDFARLFRRNDLALDAGPDIARTLIVDADRFGEAGRHMLDTCGRTFALRSIAQGSASEGRRI